MHPYLKQVFNDLVSKRFGIGDIICKKINGKPYIDFRFDNKYFGCIYPFNIVFYYDEIKKKNEIENLINYNYGTVTKNDDVCNTCKKLKFYPDIFLMTLYGNINNFINGKNVVIFVFCKHYNIIDFLEFDYIMCNTESSPSISDIWD